MAPGNHPLDWAVASFKEAIAQGPKKVTFDRWKSPDGQPFVFYVFPISTEELDAITRAARDGGISSHIETILQRCKNEGGERIFQPGHRSRMRLETNGDDINLLTSLINLAVPPPAFNLEAALKR